MAYLDNTSVTVDAVLTKKGRELIANGQPLNIQHFTLSDNGVNYTLWNPDHASGSAYYGEAIENLPQLEANTNVQYSLQNKLLTLSRDTVALPLMNLDSTSITFTDPNPINVTAQLLGYSGGVGTAGSGMHMLIQDVNLAHIDSIQGASYNQIDITGNAMSFLVEADIPSARLYEVTGNTAGGITVSFGPNTNLDELTSGQYYRTNITFIDINTGAYNTLSVQVDGNLRPQPKIISKNPRG